MSLVTSDIYLSESLRSQGSNYSPSARLFDEYQMIDQSEKQTQREEYVRRALRGQYSPNGSNDSPSKRKKSLRLSDTKEVKLRALQNRINEVRAERERIVREGKAKVNALMNQLKREQDEFAKEQEKHRKEDENIEENFQREIDALSRRLDEISKPMNDISEEVNSRFSSEQQENSQQESAQDYNTSTVSASLNDSKN